MAQKKVAARGVKKKPWAQESTPKARSRMARVLATLKATYPDAHCALNYRNAYELLVATILSAQCTDERVNQVTPVLFARYPTAGALSRARTEEIETIIRSTGFFRAKAQSIVETSQMLVARYGGEVPATLAELTALRGVGRKTANVVLGNAMGIPGLVVDTHVGRLCRRMGFTKEADPEKVEQIMMKLVPREEWTLFSHLLISHGRALCQARKPTCGACPLFGPGDCPQVM